MPAKAPREGARFAEGVRATAPAKVNLALEVVRRRKDGYHDIDTVMTTISLADTITVRPATGLEVALEGPWARGIDAADDLAGRAARSLAAAARREPDVRIEVTKRIPHPAGLGGGSSDAAAVIRALDAMWGLGWSRERLADVAAEVGSDVPFFVYGGAAHCTGRGEFVEPLKDLRPLRMLVLVPPVQARANKTGSRFGALTPRDLTSGERAQRLAARMARGAPPPTNDLGNAFEAVIERTDAELMAHYGAYHAAGAPKLHLSGAGPAVFVLVSDRAKVSELKRDFRNAGAEVFDVTTIGTAAATALEPLEADAAARG
ncbi:MAG: 4-(cytidine 5'-diphospho)-2-C-methyl-D-erythritol kinase [Dehalococcoidia bacterium]